MAAKRYPAKILRGPTGLEGFSRAVPLLTKTFYQKTGSFSQFKEAIGPKRRGYQQGSPEPTGADCRAQKNGVVGFAPLRFAATRRPIDAFEA